MRYAVVTVCLLILTSGCIVVNDGSRTPPPAEMTETPIYKQPASTPIQPVTASPRDDVNVTKLERLIHERVNEVRVEQGLEPLAYDKRLASIGRYHSWDMAQKDYYSHTAPNGRTHSELRSEFQYECEYTGQNLYYIRPSNRPEYAEKIFSEPQHLSDSIVHGWLNSTGHRENILSPHYEAEGIGVFVTKNGTIYVTQEFCG